MLLVRTDHCASDITLRWRWRRRYPSSVPHQRSPAWETLIETRARSSSLRRDPLSEVRTSRAGDFYGVYDITLLTDRSSHEHAMMANRAWWKEIGDFFDICFTVAASRRFHTDWRTSKPRRRSIDDILICTAVWLLRQLPQLISLGAHFLTTCFSLGHLNPDYRSSVILSRSLKKHSKTQISIFAVIFH